MMTDPVTPAPINIHYTSEFKRNLRQLVKRYRQIKADLQPLLDVFITGQTPGDRIAGVAAIVLKVRLRNSDSVRGKRGGYRVIYQQQANGDIVLVTIYSKTEQADITPAEIRQIIAAYEPQRPSGTGSEAETSSTD